MSELQKFHASPISTEVPQSASDNLTALKHALRDVIIDAVTIPSAAGTDANTLDARVIERIEREDVPVGVEGGDFGSIEQVLLEQPSEYPEWLIAITKLSIPYGSDSSLYVFEKQRGSWRLALTLESNGYKAIRGAQNSMAYFIAAPIEGQKPYFVTADIAASPTSVWQALRLKVLRVGSNPDTPVVLASRSLSYCLDDTYYISIRPEGFGLIYLGYNVDPELAGWRGVHYIQYKVDTKRASVVSEIAIDPYNLIEGWVNEEWSVAERRVDAVNTVSVKDWHERFRDGPYGRIPGWSCGLGWVRLSREGYEGNDRLLSIIGCEQGDDKDPSAYVTLAPGHDGFRVTSISATKPQLSEFRGTVTYFAGFAGLTDPVPESLEEPKVPADFAGTDITEARVRLGITINEDGSIDPTVVVRDWPEQKILVPAVRSVRRWKYKPGLMNGHPVKVSMDVEVVYTR